MPASFRDSYPRRGTKPLGSFRFLEFLVRREGYIQPPTERVGGTKISFGQNGRLFQIVVDNVYLM